MGCSLRDFVTGPSFEREVALAGVGPVRLRWIRPSDASLLREGFTRLSSETRRLRFFGPIHDLSSPFVRYLTEVDGCDHAALVAVADANPRTGEPARGYGVARFVRSKKDARSAELAIVVTDDVQSRGLGGQLIAALALAARERAIDSFTMSVLWSNARVRKMLQRAGAEARGSESGVLEFAIPTATLANGARVRRSTERASRPSAMPTLSK